MILCKTDARRVGRGGTDTMRRAGFGGSMMATITVVLPMMAGVGQGAAQGARGLRLREPRFAGARAGNRLYGAGERRRGGPDLRRAPRSRLSRPGPAHRSVVNLLVFRARGQRGGSSRESADEPDRECHGGPSARRSARPDHLERPGRGVSTATSFGTSLSAS